MAELTVNLDEHVTEHFIWRELLTSPTAIRFGLANIPDSPEIYDNMRQVAAALEEIRAYFGRPVRVNSCFRAESVNRAVGGSITSAHRFGLAADFTVPGVPNIEVCRAAVQAVDPYDQIIYEFGTAGWIHLGLAKRPRFERLTAVHREGRTLYFNGFQEV